MSQTFLGSKEAEKCSGVMGENIQESSKKKIVPLLSKCYEIRQDWLSLTVNLCNMIRKGYSKDLRPKRMEAADR